MKDIPISLKIKKVSEPKSVLTFLFLAFEDRFMLHIAIYQVVKLLYVQTNGTPYILHEIPGHYCRKT